MTLNDCKTVVQYFRDISEMNLVIIRHDDCFLAPYFHLRSHIYLYLYFTGKRSTNICLIKKCSIEVKVPTTAPSHINYRHRSLTRGSHKSQSGRLNCPISLNSLTGNFKNNSSFVIRWSLFLLPVPHSDHVKEEIICTYLQQTVNIWTYLDSAFVSSSDPQILTVYAQHKVRWCISAAVFGQASNNIDE